MLCQLLWIQRTRTTAYHPQVNGQVECFNRTVEAMLANMVGTEIGTNIYRRLYLHTEHHSMTQQGTHHTWLILDALQHFL